LRRVQFANIAPAAGVAVTAYCKPTSRKELGEKPAETEPLPLTFTTSGRNTLKVRAAEVVECPAKSVAVTVNEFVPATAPVTLPENAVLMAPGLARVSATGPPPFKLAVTDATPLLSVAI